MAGHDWHWTFGKHCHISFPGGGAPVNQLNLVFSSNEGCAAYSDANGNLLFYTDGSRLYDAVNTVINPQPQPPLDGTSSCARAARQAAADLSRRDADAGQPYPQGAALPYRGAVAGRGSGEGPPAPRAPGYRGAE